MQPSSVNGFGKGLPKDVEFLDPVLISKFKRIFTSSESTYQTKDNGRRESVHRPGTTDPDSRLLWGRSRSHPGGVAADQGWGVPGSRRRQEAPRVTRAKFVVLPWCDEASLLPRGCLLPVFEDLVSKSRAVEQLNLRC